MASLSVRATLGAVSFHGWTGWLPSSQDQIETFARLGQSGSGSQILNTRADRAAISAWIACANSTDAKNLTAQVEALQGTVVKLTDPWTRVIVRVRIEAAKAAPRAAKGPYISGTTAATHRVDCAFTLERLP